MKSQRLSEEDSTSPWASLHTYNVNVWDHKSPWVCLLGTKNVPTSPPTALHDAIIYEMHVPALVPLFLWQHIL